MNLKERQFNGLLVFLAGSIFAYLGASACYGHHRWDKEIPYGNILYGPVVVEMAGDTPAAGIYYLPEKTTLAGFLDLTAPGKDGFLGADLHYILRSGDTVQIDGDKRPEILKMKGATRLALNLPIDINTATRDEMVMVPGIGEKTAGDILALRSAIPGGIRKIDDLLMIKGIKEKRLEKLQRYLCVEKNRSSTPGADISKHGSLNVDK
ncbi:MAG TPA: helix-hairpin-helix domain-containing protein [Syntrophales bacterium]|nr:helix-hairpin-helix domain-containing protein [Syntrophales bacterium]HRR48251.1 helix-hairpin-helix domain-containing protein [Syntrophales bacterium]